MRNSATPFHKDWRYLAASKLPHPPPRFEHADHLLDRRVWITHVYFDTACFHLSNLLTEETPVTQNRSQPPSVLEPHLVDHQDRFREKAANTSFWLRLCPLISALIDAISGRRPGIYSGYQAADSGVSSALTQKEAFPLSFHRWIRSANTDLSCR